MMVKEIVKVEKSIKRGERSLAGWRCDEHFLK
jgi:hypothetical protein